MENSLQSLFNKYSGKSNVINGRSFVKVFKDAHLIDSKLTTTGLDIAYSKVVKKGKKMNFVLFQKGLKLAAKEKKCSYEQLVQGLSFSKGP